MTITSGFRRYIENIPLNIRGGFDSIYEDIQAVVTGSVQPRDQLRLTQDVKRHTKIIVTSCLF